MSRYAVARRRMVIEQLKDIKDKRVIEVMGNIPRERYLQKGLENQSYLDRPIKIGSNQTISQPLMVAMMTEQLKLQGTERVLEIGTGSGYQTAILSELAKEVYTIERLRELMIFAQKNIHRFGYKNIRFKVGDGTLGWKEKAPFDAIIVTAGATEEIPKSLIDQLKDGGRMVIPSGGEETQKLYLITKKDGIVDKQLITNCRFVKLIGEEGWIST